MNKSDIVTNLPDLIKNHLVDLEKQTGLNIQFEPLSSNVVAEYEFITPDKPIIKLRNDWQPEDVAHELMHMQIELIEGYHVLAWRENINKSDSIRKATGEIRCSIDDQVVHARLIKQGYNVADKVIRHNCFDDVYPTATRRLTRLQQRLDDGMAHLDNIGYGELYRSSILVQAELIQKSYNSMLTDMHRKILKRFIEAFRLHRSPEATKADKVLEFFKEKDVQTVDGHKNILRNWVKMEGLDKFVGASCYTHQGTFILPWPDDT